MSYSRFVDSTIDEAKGTVLFRFYNRLACRSGFDNLIFGYQQKKIEENCERFVKNFTTVKKAIRSGFLVFLSTVFLVMFIFPDLLAVLAPSKGVNDYLIREWTNVSGLPQNTINALVQTHEGYIWVGTSSGLARFDGVQFRIFTKLNTPALKNDKIFALYEDESDVLWVGTDGGGLCSYKDGIWKNYSTRDGLSNDHVRAITSDWQGNLWIGTDFGLNRFRLDDFKTYTTEDGLYDNIITGLALGNRGVLWVGTLRGGITRIEEEVLDVYDYNDGLLNMAVSTVLADSRGNIWVGTLGGLYFLNRREGIFRLVPSTSYTPVTTIVEDAHGTLWIGTMADGLKRMSRGVLSTLSTEDGFPDDFVRCLLSDLDRNIWVGTDTGGLLQLKEPQVGNITKDDGLPESAVHVVFEDRAGYVWGGTRNSGLCRIKNGRVIEVLNEERGLSDNRIRVLFEDSSGSLWIGTEGGGVNILHDRKIKLLTAEHGLFSNNITDILQDRNGTIWIGTDKGLNKYSEGKVFPGDSRTTLSDISIRILMETRKNILYAGTNKGLYKYSGQLFERVNLSAENSEFEVLSLYEDGAGILWMGTNGDGLKRWHNGELTSYTTENGLPDNHIFSLTEDKNGYLLMSTDKGIIRIQRRELNDFAEKKLSSVNPACFDEAEGMASRQCVGNGQPSVWETKSGRFFYPTVKGIAVLEPENLPKNISPPKVIIEEVLADGESIRRDEDISLSPKVGIIEIFFTAFDFLHPEKLRFRYKLEGYEPDFIDIRPGYDRAVRYFNLKPGMYRFIVKAANNDGVWNEQGVAFEFTIRPSFFSTPFFYFILALIFVSLGCSSLFIYYKRKRQKKRDKYKTSALDPKKAEEVVPKLLCMLEEEKLFLDPELTLGELSQKLSIHSNHLSRIINERFGISYSDFINRYRIEEAKRRLADPGERENTILDIIYSSGFYSKSVFNTAFKKFTGMTPSEYRKKHLP